MAGHSQGGHTALRLQSTEPRFLASLALMPAVVLPPPVDPATATRPTVIITAGHGARVAVNIISARTGQRHVDHDVLPAPAATH